MADAAAEPWTIGRLLTWTTDYLKESGSDSPRLDAEILLAAARECERISLYTAFNDECEEPVRARFRELVRRRASAEPVAYLVGHKEFYSLTFEVNEHVLIPRPETELLVVRLLDHAKQNAGQPLRIADVGTGSGILAVCAAKHLTDATITAVDLSGEALAVAKRNAERHEVADRIEFRESDLLSGLSDDAKFDIVVSNPPYVSESEYAELIPEVKQHEPRMALVGGREGTEVIARLIDQAAERLAAGGLLAIEFSPMIADRVVAMLEQHGGFDLIRVEKDLAGHKRIVSGIVVDRSAI